MHRLEPAIQMAVVDDLAERANLLRLIARIHGQIRMIPIAKHAETFEVGALCLDLLAREFAARRAKGARVEFVARLAVFLFHSEFNR